MAIPTGTRPGSTVTGHRPPQPRYRPANAPHTRTAAGRQDGPVTPIIGQQGITAIEASVVCARARPRDNLIGSLIRRVFAVTALAAVAALTAGPGDADVPATDAASVVKPRSTADAVTPSTGVVSWCPGLIAFTPACTAQPSDR